MKRIILIIALIVLTSLPAYAVDVTFTFTARQKLIADAAAKTLHKGKVNGKQLMKRHLIEILERYSGSFKTIQKNKMTDQEELDMLNEYNQ